MAPAMFFHFSVVSVTGSEQYAPPRITAWAGRFVEEHFRLLAGISIAGLLVYAWQNRFIEDDAFISFRYAEQLLRGNGLVWNLGERVEGYTNFLWTLIMVVPIRLGWDAAVASQVLGLALFALSLITAMRCMLAVVPSRPAALLAMILLGTNYTFSAFATSGLETQLQALLLLLTGYLWLKQIVGGIWSEKGLLATSFLAAAALLTRPDSAIVLAVMFGSTVVDLVRRGVDRRVLLRALACLIGPVLILVSSWIFWKLWYYGSVLPNTYYVKIASPTSAERGLYYMYLFALTYVLFPFLLGVLLSLPVIVRQRMAHWISILLMLVLWGIYIIITGGDHMEFRFFVPVFPFMILLFVWVLTYWVKFAWVGAIAIALMIAGSIHHQLTYADSADPELAIAPLWQYDGSLSRENIDWKLSGQALGRAFTGSAGVTIAVTPAGAIPYYSGLHTIDMLGINDPWVARHGMITGTTPGHQRIAPMSYLVRRNVNLVIAHPVVVPRGGQLSRIPVAPMDSIISFRNAAFLLIPIDSSRNLVAMYLVRSPEVDAAIARNRWEVIEARIK